MAYVAGTQRLTLRMTEEKRREKGEQARYCRGPVMGSLSVIVSLQGFEQIFVFINPCVHEGGEQWQNGDGFTVVWLKDDDGLARNGRSSGTYINFQHQNVEGQLDM